MKQKRFDHYAYTCRTQHIKGRLEIPRERYTPMREPMEMKEMTYGQEGNHIQVMKSICLTCFVQNVSEIIYPCFAQWEGQ